MESTWGVRLIKEFFLLNEFIHTNKGKPREIAQVVDVTQIIKKDYTYDSIMSDYVMYWKIINDILSQICKDYLKPMVLSNLTIPVSHIPLVLGELVHA